MIDLVKFGKGLKLKLTEEVVKSDYYTDAILGCLPSIVAELLESKSGIEVLDLACGRGYVSIVLGLVYPKIERIVATDINPKAVELTRQNVALHSLNSKVIVQQGDLFEPVNNSQFDLIVASPPAMPVTKEELVAIENQVGLFHRFSSVGGKRGRDLVDKIISQSPEYLKNGGFLVFVHRDSFDKWRKIQI